MENLKLLQSLEEIHSQTAQAILKLREIVQNESKYNAEALSQMSQETQAIVAEVVKETSELISE
jgi:glutamate synthase domain-containing protein 1